MPELRQLGEWNWLRRALPSLHQDRTFMSRVLIGQGDDAAVFRAAPGKALVFTTDLLVEGVHFRWDWTDPRSLGRKAVAVNVSDLAGMGAVQPLAIFVGVACSPKITVETVDNLVDGINKEARRYGLSFLGGDTTASRGPMFLSVSVVGEARPSGLKKREGAKPGDYLGITGPLGGARAGLEALERYGRAFPQWVSPLIHKQNCPEAQLKDGSFLGKSKAVTALMDLSDGLDVSLVRMGEASRCGFQVDAEALPVTPLLKRWASFRRQPLTRYTLHGGEDYELLFTVRPQGWESLRRALPGARIIGRVTPPRQGIRVRSRAGAVPKPLRVQSFEHFAR